MIFMFSQVQQQNGVLIFRNADVSSSGEYYCTATNSEGTDYARIIINIVEQGIQTLPERVPVIIVQVKELFIIKKKIILSNF